MPCQPNNIQNSPRIRKWGAQLERHSAFFSLRSLLFTSVLIIASGYALVSHLLGRADGAGTSSVIPIIQMGNAGLVFVTLYFVVVDHLFRTRPQEIRLIQRFIWFCTIIFIVLGTGLAAMMAA